MLHLEHGIVWCLKVET